MKKNMRTISKRLQDFMMFKDTPDDFSNWIAWQINQGIKNEKAYKTISPRSKNIPIMAS